jgi:hypothetical protein
MAGTRTTFGAAVAALALALGASAPAAHAGGFSKIFADYQKDGRIDACAYSESQLTKAKGQVPNDIEAYAPDFPKALDAALEQRAGGGCAKGANPAPGATTTAAATPATTTPAATPPAATPGQAPAPVADAQPSAAIADHAIASSAASKTTSDAGTPAPVIVLAILGVLLVLGGLGYGTARWFAWDPAWARAGRHAIAEAGWRASATWAEFTDWVRLGR